MRHLGPFQVRSYRFQWPADLLTSWAFEMETLILGWYLLTTTGSLVVLTVFGSLSFLGTLLSPLFGVVGDRVGHRNLLCCMRAFYVILASVLTTLALSDRISPGQVLATSALMGLVRPSDLVMRNAIVGDTMPSPLLTTAISTSRVTMDSARVAGALTGAAVFAALGMGPAYAVITTVYAASFILTLGIAGRVWRSAAGAAQVNAASPWRNILDALANVWSTPPVLAAMCLAFLVNLTAFPLLGGLMPYVARDVFLLDQKGLGYLVAAVASGALIGCFVLMAIGGRLRPARTMTIGTIAWYAMIVAFAHMPNAFAAAIMLVLTGIAQSFSMIPMAVMLLRSTDARYRGGVMGIRMLVVYGMPIGLMGASPLIARYGYPGTAALYCALGLALTAAVVAHWRGHLIPAEAPANAR